MDDINSIVMFQGGGSPAEAKAEAPAETTAPTGEPEAATATPAVERDEAGRFKGKQAEAKPTEATQQVEAKPEVKPEAKPTGQLAALLAERAKRQQLEQELAQLRQQPQAEKQDIWTDPEAAVQKLVDQRLSPIRQRFFTMSMQSAEGKYGQEFEAAATQFMELADANPALAQQLREADDPGEFVYVVGSNTPAFRQAQAQKSQEALSAKDAQIAALTAELETLKTAQQHRSAVPDSLNRQPSGAVPSRAADPEDINTIVRFK